MEIKDLIEGDLFHEILLETYISKDVSRPRVRPVSGLPRDIRVEFPVKHRTNHPIGTRFRADVKVCQKHFSNGQPQGNPYLRADTKTIQLVADFHPADNLYAVRDSNSKSDRSYKYIRKTAENEEETHRSAEEQDLIDERRHNEIERLSKASKKTSKKTAKIRSEETSVHESADQPTVEAPGTKISKIISRLKRYLRSLLPFHLP